MAFRRLMEYSEFRCAVGRIKTKESITYIVVSSGDHHSVIFKLWKQILIRRTGLSSKDYKLADNRCINFVANKNQKVTSTRVASMVAISICKTTSVTTVHWRPHMNGLYILVPQVCVHLSVQNRRAQFKYCRQYTNWTVIWTNIVFKNKSRFSLQVNDKCAKNWKEIDTHKHRTWRIFEMEAT